MSDKYQVTEVTPFEVQSTTPEPIRSPTQTSRRSRRSSISYGKDLASSLSRMDSVTSEKQFPKYLIHPDSNFRAGWDMLMLVALLYTLIYLPVRIAFVDTLFDPSDITLDCLFFIDVVISFFSAYRDENNKLIISLSSIAYRYITGWFIIDIFTCFPFYFIVGFAALPKFSKIIRLFRILKILRTVRFKSYIEKWEDSSSLHPAAIRIIILAAGVVTMAHVFSCVWIFIGEAFTDEYNTWIKQYKFEHESDASLYLAALYWFIVTFATLGYGDIVPRNDYERGFALIVIIVGFCVYSYLTASLASIVKSMDKNLEIYRDRTTMMQKFFICYPNIPDMLRFKLRKHFRTRYGSESAPLDNDVLMNDIPSYLRGELSLCIYGDVLKEVKAIKDMQEPAFVEALACFVQCRHYEMGDVIVTEGDLPKEWFVILKGVVHAETSTERVIYKLSEGQCFGEFALISLKATEVTIRCSTEVDVLVIGKTSLLKIFNDFPECYDILFESGEERYSRFLQLKELVLAAEEQELATQTTIKRSITLGSDLPVLKKESSRDATPGKMPLPTLASPAMSSLDRSNKMSFPVDKNNESSRDSPLSTVPLISHPNSAVPSDFVEKLALPKLPQTPNLDSPFMQSTAFKVSVHGNNDAGSSTSFPLSNSNLNDSHTLTIDSKPRRSINAHLLASENPNLSSHLMKPRRSVNAQLLQAENKVDNVSSFFHKRPSGVGQMFENNESKSEHKIDFPHLPVSHNTSFFNKRPSAVGALNMFGASNSAGTGREMQQILKELSDLNEKIDRLAIYSNKPK